jgi:hypothetical protein
VRVQLNDAPSASAGGPYSVDEGSTVTLTASGTDPEGGALSYTWDLDGNGTFETAGQSVSFSPDDGPSTPLVKVRVTDDVGQTSTAQATVTVANLAPTVTALAASPPNGLTGQGVTFTGTATDPSTADTAAGFHLGVRHQFRPRRVRREPLRRLVFALRGVHRGCEGPGQGRRSVGAVHVARRAPYDADILPPLTAGAFNLVQRGQVVPVKPTIGCGGFLGGLHPAISIRAGAYDADVDPSDPSYVVPGTSSSADTSGVMREAEGQYMYNLGVPSNASTGQLYTVLIRQFGGSAPTLYAVLKIRR